MKKNYRPRKSLFHFIESIFSKTALSEGLPIKYLPHVLLVFTFAILNIANNHYHQRILRKISILDQTTNSLRVSYVTLKASCMFKMKQSEIVKEASKLGLVESSIVPIRVPL